MYVNPLESLCIQEKVVVDVVRSMEEEWITKSDDGKTVCNCSRMIQTNKFAKTVQRVRVYWASCGYPTITLSSSQEP